MYCYLKYSPYICSVERNKNNKSNNKTKKVMVKENRFRVEVEEKVIFEALIKDSNYIQANLRSRKERIAELNEMIQLLNEADNDFLTELENRMKDLSGNETAISFVNFMKDKLKEDTLLSSM